MILMGILRKKDFLPLCVIMVFPKVSMKSKEFLLKFINRLIETKFSVFIKVHCVGMNISEISK